MLPDNPNWQRLKQWGVICASHVRTEHLTTSVILPVAECIFVNLLTGAPEGQRWPYIVALAALAAVHLWMVWSILFREKSSPLKSTMDAVELHERLISCNEEQQRREAAIQRELQRRSECLRMIRSAIDTLNLQTCQHDPSRWDALQTGFHPIVQKLMCGIEQTLGVRSNQFTLEVHLHRHAVFYTLEHVREDYTLCPCYFFSSMNLSLNLAQPWGARLASQALSRQGPWIGSIDDDPYIVSGIKKEELYFPRFVAVPVFEVCGPHIHGVLLLTSKQGEPFADDIVDTLQFVATIFSQYLASHNRCMSQWLETKKREEAKMKREERKAMKSSPSALTSTTTTTPPPLSPWAQISQEEGEDDDDSE